MADEKKSRPAYQAPIVMPLGELAKGEGPSCHNGGSASNCSTGGTASNNCNNGTTAGNRCGSGTAGRQELWCRFGMAAARCRMGFGGRR
jgi:hypothetical protein